MMSFQLLFRTVAIAMAMSRFVLASTAPRRMERSSSTAQIFNRTKCFPQVHRRPISIRPADELTQVLGDHIDGSCGDVSLPLGIPFEFESPLFKGTMLVRFRNVETDDHTGSHQAYFQGRKHTLMQTVVQGRFKRPVKMSELYVGNVFDRPLSHPPPASWQNVMNQVFKRVAPSIVLDLASAKPKILALFAGTAQSMSVDLPGEEPKIVASDLPERMARVFRCKQGFNEMDEVSSKRRKRWFSDPAKAAEYTYDTDHVYTFHMNDDTIDYGTYSIKIPFVGTYNFGYSLGGQPLSISAVTADGSSMFSFHVWHNDLAVETSPK
jgi:Protein of unknown function (DUF1769)